MSVFIRPLQLYICWRHIESGDERLLFQFTFTPGDFADKDGFAFLRLEENLCTHVSTRWPLSLRVGWVALMKTNQLTKGALEKLGAPYLPVASLLGGRPFHISRVQSFPVFKTTGQFLK